MIIKGAEPFFMQGGRHGVLLVHGFTGNPAELLMLGQHLNSVAFTVLGVRLAGHATNEKDLSRTTKEDWINSVIDGYSILSGCCETISIVGHSMGGLLTLKAADILSKGVAKIVTLAAPIFINEELGLKFLPPREQCLNNMSVKNARRRLKNVPPAVNRVYRKMPFIAIHELINLIDDVKSSLNKIKTPILIMHGREDHTANVESAQYIYDHIGSESKQIIYINNSGHLLPLDENRDAVFKYITDYLTNEELIIRN
ncbi:MAG: alpha/beta fold hydrolase [Selenomonadaceae bacterium]|nr:alpha/beta fold hydrolase [Selenomonadaceae bacterium]